MSVHGQSNGPLWSGLGLIAPLQAWLLGAMPRGVTGISIDTRTLQPGDLFFAIKGDAQDGHAHVASAFAKGAAAAVVDEAHASGLRSAGPLFVVRDVLASMVSLGLAARQRSAAWIIAVTGSAGKTSTKEALRLVLSDFGQTHASAASYNNHWGVPLTLARLPRAARYGVFEIGMNHGGEITPLVAQVRPHVAIVTTVAPVHLEHFASLDAIAAAKAEIFSGLEKGGTAIINRDIGQYDLLNAAAQASAASRVLSFGEHPEADARLDEFAPAAGGSFIRASVLGQELSCRLGAPGKHMALNALAVLLAVQEVGGDLEAAASRLTDFMPAAGRGARHQLAVDNATALLIDESYNANPASMRAALALLGAAPKTANGRRIAVIGDMLELGPEGAAMHAALEADIIDQNVDLVFAAGPLSSHLYNALPEVRRGLWVAQAAGLEMPLRQALQAGDVIMIKGSNGSRMGPLVAALKQHFAGA